jgi:tRNA dimethylallyltransferase
VHAQTGRPLSSWQTRWGFHGEPARDRPSRLVGLTRPKADLERRIRERAAAMLDAGWVEEARALRGRLARGAAQALGYAEVLAFADGELDREECIERIAVATRRFARRQRTWLRRFPGIVWIDLERGTAEDHVERARAALGW